MSALQALVDLADLLNMEPSDNELAIEFGDRVIQRGRESNLITDAEADDMVKVISEVEP